MKSFKILFLALAFISTATLTFANDVTITPKSVHGQIQSILTSHNSDFDFGNETTFKINFIVNSNSEIIVLSTNNTELDNSIKSSLNYKKIAIDNLEYNKVYTLPVTLKKY